jgi:ferritin-like metal-binding protein YciE
MTTPHGLINSHQRSAFLGKISVPYFVTIDDIPDLNTNQRKVMAMDTLSDLMEDELKDLFSAENQLLKALPKMAKKASSASLKDAFTSHLNETEGHVKRLEQIGKMMGIKLTGKTCKAMKGLIEEGKEVLEEDGEPSLIDAALIGAAQRVEHYEMAAYGTTRAMAHSLGQSEIASLLQQTLDEEGAADKKLTKIATKEVLVEAASVGDESDEEE